MSTVRKTLRQIAEDWQASVNGGNWNESNMPYIEVIYKQVHECRQVAILAAISTKKIRLNGNISWGQTIKLKRSATQPSFNDLTFPYKVFDFYPTIEMQKGDGVLSISAINHRNKLVKLTGYEHYMNISQMGSLANSSTITYIWPTNENQLATSNMALQFVSVNALFQDPTEVMTYNDITKSYESAYDPNTDPYPVSGDLLDDMYKVWLTKYAPTLQLPTDNTDNQEIDRNKAAIQQPQ